MIPATLKKQHGGRQSEIAMTVTTVKAGDAVILRIDRMGASREDIKASVNSRKLCSSGRS
jgi:hypothetical protein